MSQEIFCSIALNFQKTYLKLPKRGHGNKCNSISFDVFGPFTVNGVYHIYLVVVLYCTKLHICIENPQFTVPRLWKMKQWMSLEMIIPNDMISNFQGPQGFWKHKDKGWKVCATKFSNENCLPPGKSKEMIEVLLVMTKNIFRFDFVLMQRSNHTMQHCNVCSYIYISKRKQSHLFESLWSLV